MQLYLTYKETSTGGEAESDGRWAHHSDVNLSVEFLEVSRNEPKKENSFWPESFKSFEVTKEIFDSDKIFLVIPRFRDGGTFGSTNGYWDIFKVLLNAEDAQKMAKAILNKTFKKEYPEYQKCFLPWEGHFAGLQNVEIHCFTLQNNASDVVVHYH